MSNTINLKIKGMSCGHCVMGVTKALESIDGVKKAKVNLKKESATVKLTQGIPSELLIKAVKQAGYEAQVDNG